MNDCVVVRSCCSSVRLLESRSGTGTSEFLWLASSGVLDEKTSIVREKNFLELSLLLLVLVLLVISNDGLGDGLSESHHLVAGTSTSYSALNDEVLELVSAEQKDWLVKFHLQRLRLDEVNGSSVDSD